MKPNELKKWMDRYNKTAGDVAYLTHVSIKTVERFLAGETEPRRIIMEALEKLIQDKPAQAP